jgi:uncharacterized protein
MIPRFTARQALGIDRGRAHRGGSAAHAWRVVRTGLGALGLALVLLITGPVAAREAPALDGRVNDHAAMLSPAARRQVEAILKALETSDSTQIVVLTVPSLGGDSIEDFALRVADDWKIGQKGLDNGAILVIARQERQLRIEVGYGLEGRLTDLMAGRIIRDVIVPRLKAGQFDLGILEGVEAMAAAVRGEFAPGKRPAREGLPREALAFAIFAFIFLVSMLGRISRRLAAVGGALAAPLLGVTALGMGFPMVLALVPIGLAAGIFLALLTPAMAGGAPSHRRGPHGGGPWIGGGFGGGGGSLGGGGFSGGGGGFGGGGASGSW